MLGFIQQLFRYITQDKDILYIFCPCSIGDILITGGLCHAVLKKKRKKVAVLILNDKYANSGLINFVGAMEVRYMPNIITALMQQYVYVTREYETDNFIYGHFKAGQNGYIMNEKLSFINRYKEDVFGLSFDTELIPPIIAVPTDYQKQRLHGTYILDKERTIILAPHALTVQGLEESFWLKLVAELIKKNKDYVIYTNVASPHEKVIPGTTPIVTNFQELRYLAERVNCFIGIRSGIFDLLAFTDARLLYINTSIVHWFFDLNLNFNHTNSKAFYFVSFSEHDYAALETLMQRNNINSIDDINICGNVKGRDVFLNMESLIEKIINAVD